LSLPEAMQADVSDEAQVATPFGGAERVFGLPDILVAHAGFQRDAAIAEMTLKQWQDVLDANLTGRFLCACEAVRAFRLRGLKREISCALGKIVCMSSVHDVINWGSCELRGIQGRRVDADAQLGAGSRGGADPREPDLARYDQNPDQSAGLRTPDAEERLLRLRACKIVGTK
jgi:glucose 1-dehydrogenase